MVALLLTSLQLLGQTADSFDDNDLTNDPSWQGKTEQFSVTSGQLHLNAPASSGSAFISTSSSTNFGTWKLTVYLRFNSSSSNYCRYYLQSDNPELDSPLQGYYVQIGSASDDVSLFRQNGTTRTKIIDGIDGLLDRNDVSVFLLVERNPDGLWQLYAGIDPNSLGKQGEVVDKSFASSHYAGIQCVFTATRSTSFSFDDLMIESVVDAEPPQVTNFETKGSNKVSINFSESIDEKSASPDKFSLNGKSPHKTDWSGTHQSVSLEFEDAFRSGENKLVISRLRDLAGNEMEVVDLKFAYIPPVIASFKDVVITEIMADFSPAVSLPEVEYVEILNRSDKSFNLDGWILTDGSSEGKIEPASLSPEQIVILTNPANTEALAVYGRVIPVKGFPSLNNAGDVLLLKSPQGITIDSLSYSDSWYKDSTKKNGGWSLEIVDPDNFCEGIGNWQASESENGGTPGQINSIDAENLDLTSPKVSIAFAAAPDSVVIMFNERMQRHPSLENFHAESPHTITAITQDAACESVALKINPPLKPGVSLKIDLKSIYDCSGNELDINSRSGKMVLPQLADSLDVVINEILFNPISEGTDFVEIKNTSDKFIDISKWKIGSIASDGKVNTVEIGRGLSFILGPHEIAAFSKDPQLTLNTFPRAPADRNFIAQLPSYNDDSGTVLLLDDNGNLMDRFSYFEDLHSPFLRNVEGVSIERVSIFGDGISNWKSAAASEGYATPGYRNSNEVPDIQMKESFVVTPRAFVPGISQPDFAIINYQLDEPGFIANIRIYDARSRLIKVIAENQLLGTSGAFRWDGDTTEGTRALIGLYMVFIELYNHAGVVRHIKQSVAVAGNY